MCQSEKVQHPSNRRLKSTGGCKSESISKGELPKRVPAKSCPNRKRRSHASPTIMSLLVIMAIHFILNRPEPASVEDSMQSNQCVEHRARLVGPENPSFASLSEFMGGDIEPSGDEAVCIFKDNKVSLHFPHAMQQLYACWSYWKAHPGKKSILSIVAESDQGIVQKFQHMVYKRRNRNNPFLAGFWSALEKKAGVEIRYGQLNGAQPMVPQTWDNIIPKPKWKDGYAMLTGEGHASSLRDTLVETTSCPKIPRIGILNRQGHRSLRNEADLRKALQREFPNSTIVTEVFENKDFDEQLSFFGKVNILISPHGAQLTGLPFLPACAQMVEFFPEGYLIPTFFGSLARASNVGHHYFYLGNQSQTVDEVQEQMMKDRKRRSNVRKVELCPVTHQVVDAVTVMYQRWQECCRSTGNIV